jgi:hypothetical protein
MEFVNHVRSIVSAAIAQSLTVYHGIISGKKERGGAMNFFLSGERRIFAH